jgi:multidrug transporter EmrE-like cation transporter
MSKSGAVAILLIAAALEVCGDALVRMALRQSSNPARWLFLLAGAAVLLGYGLAVNAPDWDFGKLLGLYVVFFFLIAQGISWAFFNQPPSTSTLVGGALILAGGIVIGVTR